MKAAHDTADSKFARVVGRSIEVVGANNVNAKGGGFYEIHRADGFLLGVG